MKFQKMIEEAIEAANNCQYEADESWMCQYDALLVEKYNKMFEKCFNGKITHEEMHQLRIFVEHLPNGLLRVIGEISGVKL